MTIIEEIKAKLFKLKTNDYLRYLNILEKKTNFRKLSSLKIAVLRSYTVEPLEPLLKLRLILEGFNPKFLYGGYNQFAQEVFDNSSFLYSYKPNIILFLSRLEELLPDFYTDYNLRSFSDWKQLIKLLARQLGTYAKHIRKRLDSQMIFQNMSFCKLPYWGVYDAQHNQNQVHLVHEFNQLLINELSSVSNVFIWDFNHFLSRKGYDSVYDPKMWYLSKNPFKHSAYPEIVADLCRYLISAIGKVKKCIVLDLDNTLWGGIVGEDGFDGIALGNDYPGNCYREFQKELLKLYHRGILLAINSKNNEDDCFEVIDKHPGMILRRKHFAAYRINWKDKATNLLELAQEINIGIDSMIFIDDNSRECELIRQKFPECKVIELPKTIYDLPKIIQVLPDIENIRLTEEDKKRGEMYQAQIARRSLRKTVSNLEDYLKSLEIEVFIEEANNFSISRIAQLTQKTNQMNLTTRRYSESDIRSFMEGNNSLVYYVSAKDRLGDHGIVGVIILKIKDKECLIDTFLISCRIIGLTIEQSMLAFIQEKARERGCKVLIGEYIPTKKNRLVSNFYEKAKFKKINDSYFTLDLDNQNIQYSSFIKHKK
ncbi:MAG: HAD-IIIC family phosphatase [Promethearchaeota archaeon]